MLQFNRLTMTKGVLHWLFINNDVEYHQMVLPLKYLAQVLQLLHGSQSHQGFKELLPYAVSDTIGMPCSKMPLNM